MTHSQSQRSKIMVRQCIKVLIALAIAASAPYALAKNKRADEAGGGVTAGGSGSPKGGADSAAGQHGTKRASDRLARDMLKEKTKPSKETTKTPKQGSK